VESSKTLTKSLLFGVTPTDRVTLASVSVGLMPVAEPMRL